MTSYAETIAGVRLFEEIGRDIQSRTELLTVYGQLSAS